MKNYRSTLSMKILSMKTLSTATLLMTALFWASLVHADEPLGPVYIESTGFFAGDAAIGGYDPVAIVKDGEARQGSADFKLDWNGAQWHFVNAENRRLFEEDTAKYAPQFGGHCAWAMGRDEGELVKGSAKSWTLHEGKLYLNYNDRIMKRWRAEMEAKIVSADENWERFVEP